MTPTTAPRRPVPGRLLATLPLALALAACGVTRPPAAVQAPAPAQWRSPVPADALPHHGSTADLTQWWRQAGDPLLADLIEAAQAASPNVASAAARVTEARGARTQAGAALAPRLDGNLSATRSASPLSGTSTSTTTNTSSTSVPPATVLQATLQPSWEIDLFGGLRASRDAAIARLDAGEARWHDARIAVAAETANAYFAERACARQLAVAEADTRSRSETARLTGLSADAGFTAPADAALARASAADASARLTQQRAQCRVLRHGLVALTGLPAEDLDRRLDAQSAITALPTPPAVDAVPAQTLLQRPDLFAAERAVAAASAEAGAAQAQRYPRLTLSGSVGRLQLRTQGFRASVDTWSVGPVALSVPLFDGGVSAANAESARARYEEAVVQYRASVRQAVREVEEALTNLDSTRQRAADADTAVRGYQAALDAAQSRYQTGLASLFELEDARRTLFAAQTARVSLQRESNEAWVALYRAVGGGWQRPDADTAATALATAAGRSNAAVAAPEAKAAPTAIPTTTGATATPHP
ncbi:NodT family efflux transporter outer membrane factor (OMF) lipoprotein [Pseudacidovorax intermedius]|uniref:NodT family efflux transporter outer membrane factor (OMF) lipoprotein n=1 Tax=Pseudacidovorax intermedius TaxID=433924 RepID=A0A370FHZ7_9BURK|nr:efflux transporter outer membrane subunit [Pseudacidovorax intermedius]RDI23538.1 NodT family efflux transporter outer membrane factor (OMF) lipoprotein [Pseudacidovorax intermedius]